MVRRPTRRQVLPLLGAAALAFPAALRAREAAAILTWCRTDPLFLVDDKLVDVTLASEAAMLAQATGPVRLVLTVPVGSTVTTLFVDAGFGHGYDIAFATAEDLKRTATGPQVRAAVLAPAAAPDLPVRVYYTTLTKIGRVLFRSTAVDGWSNAWIYAE